MKTTQNQRLDALAKITTSKDKVIWRKVGAAFLLYGAYQCTLKLNSTLSDVLSCKTWLM